MEPVNVTFSMSIEDRSRLRALAEALRITESELVSRLIRRDYNAWEEGVVTGEGEEFAEET